MEDKIVPHKLKCNHCGEIIESGIFSVSNHSFDCKAKKEINMGNYTIATTPYWSFTEMPIEDKKDKP